MEPSEITIRALASHEERAACVELQEAIWGPGFNETVPASLLAIVPKIGGVAGGAFTPSGELVGCVFGMTGPDEEGLLHWSDLVGVVPAMRGQGLAARLKRWQAEEARRAGATRMRWTFDPLQAPNAQLNLVTLGARVVAYLPDMYPASTSPLHAGGTDRLLVEWRLDDPPARETGGALGPVRRIEIPGAPGTGVTPEALADLRCDVREAFTSALAEGWRVTGFARGATTSAYLLAR